MVITGERKRGASTQEGTNEGREARRRQERGRFGPFERRFMLPEDADAKGIAAKVDNGVLVLLIPRSDQDQTGAQEVPVL